MCVVSIDLTRMSEEKGPSWGICKSFDPDPNFNNKAFSIFEAAPPPSGVFNVIEKDRLDKDGRLPLLRLNRRSDI